MLANGDVFAGYVIDRQLGRGGMGSVYLAKHPRLPRMTALKLLNREMVSDDEIRARFEREADLVAQLDHPKIVTVYDRGLEDGQLWISMQYIDGIDAASLDPRKLPPERAVQVIEEVAEALDYAHNNGVLHRDVKPGNMLLAKSTGGKGERVYLTDFGIARLRDDGGHLTQTGTFTATLAYASPEQLTGASLDGRSDQYSLACSLFWLFTGRGPFTAPNPAAVIRGHLQGPPPALSSVRQGLPAALDGVLLKAMSKRPDDRFATCADFAAAARRTFAAPSAPPMPVAGQQFGGPAQGRPGTGPSNPVAQPPMGQRPPTGPGAHTAGPMQQPTGGRMPQPTGGPMQQPTGGQMPQPTGGPMQQHTGGGMPHTAWPMQYPAGQMPQPGPGSVRSATPPPQPVYQQSPQYPQQGGYGYPPPQQGKSNNGLIIGLIFGAVLLLVVVLIVILALG